MKLKFEDIPESDIVAFSEGVLLTLEKLAVDYLYDETSPPDSEGNCTFVVVLNKELLRD